MEMGIEKWRRGLRKIGTRKLRVLWVGTNHYLCPWHIQIQSLFQRLNLTQCSSVTQKYRLVYSLLTKCWCLAIFLLHLRNSIKQMLGDKQIPGIQLCNTVIWAEMPFKCQGLVTHGWVWAKPDDHSLPLNIIILCQHKLCFRVLGFSCRLNINDMILVQCFIVVHSSSPKDENHLFWHFSKGEM